MDAKRGKAYVWVTWITGLLAGTDKCWWKAWVKANFRYAKRPDDDPSSLADWTRQHDAMVEARAAAYRAVGLTVMLEDENSFKVEGKAGILSGKPDLVALTGPDEAHVVDAKSGSVKAKDAWQVFIYMWALPLTVLKGRKVKGSIEYRHGLQDVGALLPAHVSSINTVMKAVTNKAVEPPTTPSVAECRYCDVIECKARVGGSGAPTATVEGF